MSYHEAKTIILESKSVQQLYKNVKLVDAMVKSDKIDHYQAQKLEEIGFKKFESLQNETKHIIKNKKLIF